ncbi:hypothetical protein AFCDBAGC_4443 [Methylobacterium cerastii]|uniref:Uncharacterized protein n=1 Tax=Methylobacterium cerastii TaxID=932741 RepID=A0ABQ4QMR7_9HYPH|nr:hypothetical protein [Methylobacterium cerastii]GJD46561.1 hypothetical protein AFCDBAGC_4443 [Methylobacterium cerastii]
MASLSFVDGLYRLDAAQTRRRLADAMAVARAGTDGDAVRRVEAELLRTARWAVRHLDLAIVQAERAAAPEAEATYQAVTTTEILASAFRDDEPPPGC